MESVIMLPRESVKVPRERHFMIDGDEYIVKLFKVSINEVELKSKINFLLT
jgi:hypothetical protein